MSGPWEESAPGAGEGEGSGTTTGRRRDARPIKLTKLQRKNLIFSKRFRGRDQPMTLGGLIWITRVRFLVLALYLGLAGGWMYWVWGNIGAATMAAAIFGVFLRDLSALRRAALLWPVSREVIDWDRVDHLLARDDAGKNGSPAV